MKTLVVVHVYYPQLWPELAACVRNIDGERDLVVTYGDEAQVQGVRRDFPEARFLKCENRGYDIWPFVASLDEEWWSLIRDYSKRDQLSLMWLFWKRGWKLEEMSFENARLLPDDFLVFAHKGTPRCKY